MPVSTMHALLLGYVNVKSYSLTCSRNIRVEVIISQFNIFRVDCCEQDL